MRKLIVTYKQFEVVVVPFPFTDSSATKKRPALVISDASAFNKSTKKSVMAMITTASHSSWDLDIPITDLKSAGLKAKSIIRMKLFTLDDDLVLKKIGKLATSDRDRVQKSLQQLFNLESDN
ncbi:MAG: type II toxin-antitoxin system PemK/MazF family toxin [Pleurocapsa minor HA4230-MV1]|nr:type II toxin-antitoxin system PemK/MazF family toxin [Pleurocapsa minor HA4230-MV1]